MRISPFALTAAGLLAVATTAHAEAAPAAPHAANPPASATTTTPGPDTEPTGPANDSTLDGSVSLFGALGYGYGFGAAYGVGARYQWVVAPHGVLHNLPSRMHDEFALEPGFDYFHSGYNVFGADVSYNEFTPLVGFAWNFWINDALCLYPKIDLGFRIISASATANGVTVNFTNDYSPLYFQGAAGVAYKMGRVSLRGEVGWEALRLGVALSI